MLASGYSWWLFPDVSTHGKGIDSLIVWLHWFMAALFVGWGIYFVYVLVRFRARPGHDPSTKQPKAKVSKYVELGVVVVEVVLLLGFSMPLWAMARGPANAPTGEDTFKIRVVSEQFAWNVHYPGDDGEFGPTDPKLITTENPIGLDRSEEAGAGADDIVTLNQMHVPVNQDVLVHLTSKDVIHGFNLPMLRVKQDIIPGMSIPVWFRATKTSDNIRQSMTRTIPTDERSWLMLKNHVAMQEYASADGTVIVETGGTILEETRAALATAGIAEVEAAPAFPNEIACAQLCGLSHFRMRGYMHIDTESQYLAWYEEEKAWLEESQEEEEY